LKKHTPKLLLVDDDEAICTQLKWALCQDYEILLAGDQASAVEIFRLQRPAVVVLDLGLPPSPNDPEEGLATLGRLRELDPFVKVIILSGQNEKETARRAVGAGAYDFLCKPLEVETLQLLLQRAYYLAELEREFRELQQGARIESFEGILGASPQMQGVFTFIRKVAPTSAPVLLLGESGTGKEMAALAIHRRSPRRDGRFIAINCNAIPENLLESELFGHEKGAFTGAHQQRIGLVESAAGGTLFLDEIGELPLPIQVKLLRFLQDQRIQRVGGRQEIQIDARVVAATHADLKKGITAGTFREDLYFRLAVVIVKLPPLRERGEDVPLVAREFLQRYTAQNGKTGMSFSSEALRAINRHDWPGNVRELQNRVQRAVIMADGKRITVGDLELAAALGTSVTTLREARETAERELVQKALHRHLGKISSAAAELGISRPTFYELMEKLGIAKEA
jgi:two-component system NtrC family response regulator